MSQETAARKRMAQDPTLEAVLGRLCEQLGGRIWKTQAVKLPYLVDLVAVHVLGRKITETKHEAWDMGVVATSAWSLMKHNGGGDHFDLEVAEYSEDAWQLVLKKKPQVDLDAEEIAIIDFVADEYGKWPMDQLMTLTKSLNPDVAMWGPPSDQIVETEEAYRRLPLWFGEDEADAQIARQRLREIDRCPDRLIRGNQAGAFLRQLARPS